MEISPEFRQQLLVFQRNEITEHPIDTRKAESIKVPQNQQILPYLLLDNYYVCLALSLICAVLIIAIFKYYISVMLDELFCQRCIEMAALSLGVAGVSFIFGYLICSALRVEI